MQIVCVECSKKSKRHSTPQPSGNALEMAVFAGPTLMALLLLASSPAWGSHPSGAAESALDQYPARQDHPPRQATDQPPKRGRRSFYPWTAKNHVALQPAYQSVSMWKAPTYTLSRPYYIPVFGAPGRIPIYFPPQPLMFPYRNPGQPPHNPAFQGPTYLPPDTSKPTTTTSTTTAAPMPVDNRFEQGTVWFNSKNDDRRNPEVATRKPPPRTSTLPPLQHRPDEKDSTKTTTTTPTPPPQDSQPVGPSSCVWAIISCCSAEGQINYDCFEQRGCPGVFWGRSPCDSDFARAAIASALNYYNE